MTLMMSEILRELSLILEKAVALPKLSGNPALAR
jgi:hypothetical protein